MRFPLTTATELFISVLLATLGLRVLSSDMYVVYRDVYENNYEQLLIIQVSKMLPFIAGLLTCTPSSLEPG